MHNFARTRSLVGQYGHGFIFLKQRVPKYARSRRYGFTLLATFHEYDLTIVQYGSYLAFLTFIELKRNQSMIQAHNLTVIFYEINGVRRTFLNF
jgi:hypothetical protein